MDDQNRMESVSSKENEEYLLDRVDWLDSEDWQDVTPVEPHSSEVFDEDDTHFASPCVIRYTPDFAKINSYFRAVLQSKELSERTFRLTHMVLEKNPANYTAWHFRREVIQALFYDLPSLLKELDFVTDFAFENPKNYQIWHHRRSLVDYISKKDPDFFVSKLYEKETKFLAEVFDDDSKNYHAWSHRQFFLNLLSTSEKLEPSIHQKELTYINLLIEKDIRNNSAWNYRFFIFFFLMFPDLTKLSPSIKEGILKSEWVYTKPKIELVPENESPFSYLNGVLDKLEIVQGETYDNIIETLEAMKDGSRFVKSFLLERFTDTNPSKAISFCQELEKEDKIREKYWKVRQNELQNTVQSS